MNLGSTLKGALLAIAGTVALAASASAQTVTYTNGDLLVGFRASGGVGSDTTFVYNLGSSVSYRDGLFSGVRANVGTQLSATYGADWYTRSDVSWGVIGAVNNLNPQLDTTVVNGDPGSTLYASKAATGIQTSTAWGSGTAFTRSQVVSAATQVVSFTHTGSQVAGTFAFQTAAANTGGLGAFVNTSATNDYANYTTPSADFSLFTGGIEGTFGTSTEFAYLDLYRVLASTSGASPTGTVGRGSYETTFSINSAGQISVASAIPEPSSFASIAGVIALGVIGTRRRRSVQA